MKQFIPNTYQGILFTLLTGLLTILGGCSDDEGGPIVTVFDSEYSIELTSVAETVTMTEENSEQRISSTLYANVDPDFRVLEVGVGYDDDSVAGQLRGIRFQIPIDTSTNKGHEFPVRQRTGDFPADREDWVEINYVPLSDHDEWAIGEVSSVSGTFTVNELGSWLIGSNNSVIGSFEIHVEGQKIDPYNPDSNERYVVDLQCSDFRVCDPE